MIYLDTAALVKLVRIEAESTALATWLNARPAEPLVASALVEVELPRALRRSQPGVLACVAAVLARLHRVEASDQTITAFVTYDKRLAEAAANLGFTVAAPISASQ